MGALQLTYEPKFKIVHRTGELMRSHEAKSVQLWLSIDPLAEKFPNMSPYAFCNNNPLYFVDPTGMAPTDWYRNNETGKVKWIDGSNKVAGYTNIGYTWGHTDVNNNRLLLDGETKQISYNGKVLADFNISSTISGDGIKVWGVGGDAIAGSGDVSNDRGSASMDMPGHDFNSLFDFGQLIGKGVDWLFGNDKAPAATTGTPTTTTTQTTTSPTDPVTAQRVDYTATDPIRGNPSQVHTPNGRDTVVQRKDLPKVNELNNRDLKKAQETMKKLNDN